MRFKRTIFIGAAVAGVALMAGADTLVLRNGRRIQGELVGVSRDGIEFRESGLFGGGKLTRYDRSDVRGIEIDESGSGSSGRDDETSGFGGRPPGLRERDVSVAAATGFTDTRIDVRRGDTLYFEASGEIRWGKDRKDGPEGEGGNHYNPGRPIPGRPGGGLIGRVGSGDDYFFVGKERGAIRMPASGRLSLGVNDDYLLDNSGSFRVRVYY